MKTAHDKNRVFSVNCFKRCKPKDKVHVLYDYFSEVHRYQQYAYDNRFPAYIIAVITNLVSCSDSGKLEKNRFYLIDLALICSVYSLFLVDNISNWECQSLIFYLKDSFPFYDLNDSIADEFIKNRMRIVCSFFKDLIISKENIQLFADRLLAYDHIKSEYYNIPEDFPSIKEANLRKWKKTQKKMKKDLDVILSALSYETSHKKSYNNGSM